MNEKHIVQKYCFVFSFLSNISQITILDVENMNKQIPKGMSAATILFNANAIPYAVGIFSIYAILSCIALENSVMQ